MVSGTRDRADGISLRSFFDEVQRIGASGYIPNEADVLHARTKTTGISETKFKSGQLSIQCVLASPHVLSTEPDFLLRLQHV